MLPVDERTLIEDGGSYPWNCIGLLLMISTYPEKSPSQPQRLCGTAFLISPTLILTAAHNLGDKINDFKLSFYPKSLTDNTKVEKEPI